MKSVLVVRLYCTSIVTGGCIYLTRQWQNSPDGITGWADIAGATGVNYTAPSTTAGTTYYRIVITDPASDCSDPISTPVVVVVQPDATVTVSPVTNNVCVGGSVTLTATVTGGSTGLTKQWQSSTSGSGPWSPIGGQTGNTYNPPTGSAGTIFYRVAVTDSGSNCAESIFKCCFSCSRS